MDEAIQCLSALPFPCAAHWGREEEAGDEEAVRKAADSLGIFSVSGMKLLRDRLGRPYLARDGAAVPDLHVSNTHDGGMRVALAAFHTDIAGIGIDAVALNRLRRPGKGRDYLLRLAQKVMDVPEWEIFLDTKQGSTEEEIRREFAAVFSLKEAASKALGVGLKLGGGFGTPQSLPLRDMVVQCTPEPALLPGPVSRARMAEMGAEKLMAFVGQDQDFLVSAVFLLRKDSPYSAGTDLSSNSYVTESENL